MQGSAPLANPQPDYPRRVVELIEGERRDQLGNARRQRCRRGADAAVMHERGHPRQQPVKRQMVGDQDRSVTARAGYRENG